MRIRFTISCLALAGAAWVAIAVAQETPAPSAPAGPPSSAASRPASAPSAPPPAADAGTTPGPAADTADKPAAKAVGTTGAGRSSPQRFEPTEKVRPDFDVAFPIDI